MGAHRAAWSFVGVGAHRYACTEGCIERCVCRYVDRCSCTEGRTEALGRFRQPGAGLHGTELFPSVPAGPSRPVQPRGPFVRAARCPGRAGGQTDGRTAGSGRAAAAAIVGRRGADKGSAPRPAPPRPAAAPMAARRPAARPSAVANAALRPPPQRRRRPP